MIRLSRAFPGRARRAAPAAAARSAALFAALFAALPAAGAPPAEKVPRGDWLKAQYHGQFGPVVPWPLIPIHAVLLPDGRVMSYGSDAEGTQSAQLNYAVWDPVLGTGPDAHLVLPNTTGTDVFCSAQTLLPSGTVLLAGGNLTTPQAKNLSVDAVNVFDPASLSLTPAPYRMGLPRWYPSVLLLASGEALVLGGRADLGTNNGLPPEIYSPGAGWRTLGSAANFWMFSYGGNWIYPKAWQSALGTVDVFGNSGEIFRLNTEGKGSFTVAATRLPPGHSYLPSVMYAPGKILSLRLDAQAVTVDIDAATPAVAATAPLDQLRLQSNATVLADGRIFVNGGSSVSNEAVDPAYASLLWSPGSGVWTAAATAARMRLYHSISLLLPDATVLTAGGGAPGPQTNLDAEIYYPPYLYRKDWSGRAAARPSIRSAPGYLRWGQDFSVRADTPISRLTLVRTGSVTHSHNFDQRFIELPLRGWGGSTRTSTAPSGPLAAPPGFYMLFVFNSAGVPSVAKVVRLGD